MLVKLQREKMKEQRDNVGLRGHPDLLINFDFSPFSHAYDSRRSLNEAMNDTQNLIISVYYRDKDDKVACVNIDNFAPESNDHFFFRRVLLNVFSLDIIHNAGGRGRPDWIEFWSDGGPKHFKIRRSIFFVCVELMRRNAWLKRLTWAFYAAHHGKSVNDAHAAVVKRTLRRLARSGFRTEGPQQLADVAANLKNTDAFFFDKFDREEQFDVSAIPGIKSAHFFEWRGKEMDGDKYVIMCGKNYPACDKRTGEPLASDDGNMTRVPVEAFYSVDFDDASGESLDVDPAVAAAQRSAEAEARRDAKLKEKAEEVLRKLRTPGTRAVVQYESGASKSGKVMTQWWTGVVKNHRKVRRRDDDESADIEIEQIEVQFEVNELSKKRGVEEVTTERVDLDTGVRLAG